jgi:hypothetical protein
VSGNSWVLLACESVISVVLSWRCYLVVRIAREEFRQRHELEALTVAIDRADHAASLTGTEVWVRGTADREVMGVYLGRLVTRAWNHCHGVASSGGGSWEGHQYDVLPGCFCYEITLSFSVQIKAVNAVLPEPQILRGCAGAKLSVSSYHDK